MNAPGKQPFLPETPASALGEIREEKVFIEDKTFLIQRPTETDKMLTHDAIVRAFEADEFLPYWADLWPASRMLAKAVLHEPWTPGQEALEIGCGLGLPGLAALSVGLNVTFHDYDATALRFAALNAQSNGFTNFRTLQFDWRSPPEDLAMPILLASDLIYEARHVEPLVNLIQKALLPGGLCLLTDQDRAPAQRLRDMLTERGLAYTTRLLRAGEPGGRRVKGTLYRITHAG